MEPQPGRLKAQASDLEAGWPDPGAQSGALISGLSQVSLDGPQSLHLRTAPGMGLQLAWEP